MNKDKILNDIFNDDPLDILEVKPKISHKQTDDERLMTSFAEINAFIDTHGKEPEANPSDVAELKLYLRLQGLRENEAKIEQLLDADIHQLFQSNNRVGETIGKYEVSKEINSLDDLLDDDSLDILSDDEPELFDFKHISKEDNRIKTDFAARRKPCKDFEKYKENFKQVHDDLTQGRRKLLKFGMGHLKVGNYYLHNGLVFYLESVSFDRKEHYREDGRTRCIFENGTESNMLFRSVSKVLYANGKTISPNTQKAREGFVEDLSGISGDDEATGYIYVLKSKSTDKQIASIKNLYKIGFSKNEVESRIQNAQEQPTYLMAEVKIIEVFKCFNLNPQKFEKLLHNFFGHSCLDIDVFDKYGKRHSPREWFIAPLDIIIDAIALLDSGEIINYHYDVENKAIVSK